MSPGARHHGSQTWLDSLGEWAWPGQRVATAEVLPPSWVPSSPLVREQPAASAALPQPWLRARRLLIAALLSALAAVCTGLALQGRLPLTGATSSAIPSAGKSHAATPSLLATPTFQEVSRDAAGSQIAEASYHSRALRGQGSFVLYMPPGAQRPSRSQAAASTRYPVLYLLHGNSQRATAFLDIGLQRELDGLIAAGKVPPLIAVMIQGGPGDNNWRNLRQMYYESYVLEVQEMIDRTLPTVASRGARAIAGVSMGGYGAMLLALNNPYRFGTVESWLGFFNGLEDQLRVDRHAISALGMHAFVYGGKQDRIADPSQNAPFAAQLRAAGASAHGAVYPGEHNLETVQAHLPDMLTFAGRALAEGVASNHGAS
jgi:enterochelin esterase-like enzyme